MKEIYVVTAGSYSDYHICAVFSTIELANAYAKVFSEADVEAWKLDVYENELRENCKPYFVRMTKEGNTEQIRIEDSDYGFGDENTYGFDVNKNLYNHCFAKDEEHAIKITNELRTFLIAENKWKD